MAWPQSQSSVCIDWNEGAMLRAAKSVSHITRTATKVLQWLNSGQGTYRHTVYPCLMFQGLHKVMSWIDKVIVCWSRSAEVLYTCNRSEGLNSRQMSPDLVISRPSGPTRYCTIHWHASQLFDSNTSTVAIHSSVSTLQQVTHEYR